MINRLVLTLIVGVSFSALPLLGDVYTVTDPGDSGSGDDLRSLITAAGDGDTIDFNLPDYSADPDITLTSGPIGLFQNIVIIGPSGEELSIAQSGSNDEIFSIGNTINFSMRDVKILNGTNSGVWLDAPANLNFSGVTFENCQVTTNNGGAIHIGSGGNINLTRCYFNKNRSQTTHGGAIAAGNNTYLRMDECFFFENRTSGTSGNGGAIYFVPSGVGNEIRAVRTTFENNTSDVAGGAIYISSFDNNNLFRNCTFFNNIAGTSDGGAICAVDGSGARWDVEYCSFVGNRANSGQGGAMFIQSPIRCANSIFAGNAGNAPAEMDFGGNNMITSLGGNVLENDGGPYWNDAGDQLSTPLTFTTGMPEDNGGHTPTIAVEPSSANVDFAIDIAGIDYDQRNNPYVRSHNGAPDAGAFEYQPPVGGPTITLVASGSTVPGVGDAVTVSGSGFTTVTTLVFHGVTLTQGDDYTILDDNNINLTIPEKTGIGTSDTIYITNSGGTTAYGDFQIYGPQVYDVSPNYGFAGDTLFVSGDNLDSLSTVTINGVNCEVVYNDEYVAQVVIPTVAAGQWQFDIGTLIDTVNYNNVTVLSCPSGTNLYVREGFNGAVSGHTWTAALGQVFHALEVARECPVVQEVWISEGNFPTSEVSTSDQSKTFNFPGNIVVRGGFANSGAAAPTVGDQDVSTYVTTLDGNLGGGFSVWHTTLFDNVSDVTLDGVTITSGTANGFGGDDDKAGGALVRGSTVTFNQVTFAGNTADVQGGALAGLQTSTITIVSSRFINNSSSSSGGGIYLEGGSRLTAYECEFNNNVSDSDGGAVFNSGQAEYVNCIFHSNNSGINGGAITNSSSTGNDLIFTNCTFNNNNCATTGSGGGGAMFSDAGNWSIRNSILWGNLVDGANTGVDASYVDNGPTSLPAFVNSNVEHSGFTSPNNDEDPLFTSAPLDLTVSLGSAGIDAGNDGLNTRPTDFGGNTRIQGAAIDMGAYEYEDPCFGFSISLGADITGACGDTTLTPSYLLHDSYAWFSSASPSVPIGSTNTFTVIAPTTETYWVRADSGACQTFDTINVATNEIPTVSIPTATECHLDIVSIDINFSGGSTFSMNYNINGGSNQLGTSLTPTDSIENITITGATNVAIWGVSSNTGCSNPDTVTQVIGMHPAITIGAELITQPTCFGGNDGAIDNNVTGGSGGLTYSWVPTISTTEDAIGIPAGNYTFTVEDGQGCQKTDFQVVLEPGPVAPAASVGTTNTSCGLNNGIITISGLTNGVSYQINYDDGGGTGQSSTQTASGGQISISGLAPDTYSSFVIDSSGCTSAISGSYVIGTSATLSFSVADVNPTCALGDGVLSLSGLAATTTYDYSYDLGGTGSGTLSGTTDAAGVLEIGSLGPGVYDNILVAQGACNHLDPGTYTLTNPVDPVIAVTSQDPTCSGADGEVYINGLNDAFAYDVAWNDGAPQSLTANPIGGIITITGLNAGSITGVEVDSLGCTSNQGSVVLTDPTSPTITTSFPTPDCFSTAEVYIDGLTSGFSYDVYYEDPSPQNTTQTATAGRITLTFVTDVSLTNIYVDSLGCTSNVESGNVVYPPDPIFSVLTTDPTCDDGDGNLQLDFGITRPSETMSITYDFNSTNVPDGRTTDLNGLADIDFLSAGTYENIQVTDIYACTYTDPGPYVLTVAPVTPTVSITGPSADCEGEAQSWGITGVTNEGTSPSYNWTVNGVGTNPGTTFGATPTNGDIIKVTLTSSLNCASGPVADSIVYTAYPLPATPVISGADTLCAFTAGNLYSTASNTGSSYAWSTTGGLSVETPSTTASVSIQSSGTGGTVDVVETDLNGCESPSGTFPVIMNSVPDAITGISGPASVCENGSAVFEVPNIPARTEGFTWTVPAGATIDFDGGDSIAVTLASTSGYIKVEATNDCGAGTADSILITIDSLPFTPVAVNSPDTVCAGSQVSFTVDPTNHATSYNWIVSGATLASANGVDSIAVDVGTTTFQLDVSAENACGNSATISKSINVESVGTSPISGSATPACSGTDVPYAVTGGVGSTYSWTVPTGATIDLPSDGASVTVDFGTFNGDVEVTETTARGCIGTPQTLAVTLTGCALAANIQVSSDTICEGESITFTNISTGTDVSTIYTWDFDEGTLSNLEGPHIISYTSAGVYNVNLSVSLPGPADDTTIQVVVFADPTTPLVVAGPDSICEGLSSVNYSVNSQVGHTYQWSIPSGATIASGNGSDMIEVTPGLSDFTVYVQEFGPGGCAGLIDSIEVKVISAPGLLGAISGEVLACQGEQGLEYSVAAIPGATSYQWTFPGDAVITSVPADSNVVTVDFGQASDTVRVHGNNTCGIGPESVRYVELDSLPEPAILSAGPTVGCVGSTSEYVVTSVGAEFLDWTSPNAGSTLFTDFNGIQDTAFVTFTNAVDSFTVTPRNTACGSGETLQINFVVDSIPNSPILVGPTSVCENASGITYTLSNAGSATGINWDVSGATFVDNGDSIEVSTSTTDFTIEVSASSFCGDGDTTTTLITIDALTAGLSVGDTVQGCEGTTEAITALGGAADYQWYQDGVLLPNDTLASINVEAPNGGSYWAELSLGGCVGYSDTTLVLFNALPVVDLGADTSVCDSMMLSMAGFGPGATFSWLENGGLAGSDSSLWASDFGNTSTYIGLVSDVNGCVGSDTVVVTVTAPFVASLTPGTGSHLCDGDSLVLTVSTGDSYQWYQDGAMIAGATTDNYAAMTEGDFYAGVFTGACIAISDTVSMTASMPIDVMLGPDQTSCDSVVLTASGFGAGYTYNWTMNGSPAGTDSSVVANQDGSDMYIVVVTDADGCTGTDTIVVTIDNALTAVIDPASGGSYCAGDSIALSVNAGSFTYQWYLDGNPIVGGNDFTFYASAPGDYHAELTGSTCNATSDTITITEDIAPVVDLGNDVFDCIGANLVLSGFAGHTFEWSIGGVPQGTDSVFTYNTPGTTVDIVAAVTAGGSCTGYDTIEVEIGANVSIPLNFGDTTICDGDDVIYTAQTLMDSYQWYLDGVALPNDTLQAAVLSQPGAYHVVGSDNGCGGVSDTIVIDTLGTPAPQLTDIAICNSQQEQFEVTGFSVGHLYRWYDNLGVLVGSTNILIDSTAGVSDYILEVEAPNGCVGSATGQIAIDYQISVEAIVSDTAQHDPTIELNVLQNVVGAGNADNIITIQATSDQIDDIIVQGDTLVVISPDEEFSGIATINYTIQNACDAVNGAVDFLITPKTQDDFTSEFIEPEVIAWNFSDILLNDFGTLNESTLNFNPISALGGEVTKGNGTVRVKYNIDLENTVDTVTYWVCDAANSCDTSYLFIPIGERPVTVNHEDFVISNDPNDPDGLILTVYNAVSPNDDGVQDFFKFTFLQGSTEVIPTSVNVSIFNAWGDLVFFDESYDYTDSEHRFGGVSNQPGVDIEQPSGSYFYVIEWRIEDNPLFDKYTKEQGYLFMKR